MKHLLRLIIVAIIVCMAIQLTQKKDESKTTKTDLRKTIMLAGDFGG